ncbi:type I pantothenate kinase [Frankia sp. QA3]|uniref:type I pantothenate kinase n=1 Tax=Frankia sp. QA3 TaxID=710111 RepID=UPI000269BFE7|nr:type I pantothenate kinase [Frankia sp. QA3]EIV92463.1 panthothenate kinase [Frankia sp. QA3]
MPLLIGIAGPVAVGKSTIARVLGELLSRRPAAPSTGSVTTDGFLYPNRILERRGLLDRKGFPESYDQEAMLRFLAAARAGRQVRVPVYSHEHYDVVPGRSVTVGREDILIVEGLNVLQSCRRPDGRGPAVDLTDLFDLTLYVDAELDDLRRWYVARLRTLLRTARGNPPAHLRRYACLSAAEIAEEATRRYREINEVNLVENIQPTRERADVIVRKGSDHAVREVLVRGSGDATTSAAASALPAITTMIRDRPRCQGRAAPAAPTKAQPSANISPLAPSSVERGTFSRRGMATNCTTTATTMLGVKANDSPPAPIAPVTSR